jgi:hypothetical protein
VASTINSVPDGIIFTADASGALNIQVNGSNAIEIGTAASVVIGALTGTTSTFTTVADVAGNVRAIPQTGSVKTSAYTLSISDIGEYVQVGTSGSVVVPNSVFSNGDVVLVVNNTTGNISIDCPITTAYAAGTNTDRASLTLATRGVANVLFIANSICIVSGNIT